MSLLESGQDVLGFGGKETEACEGKDCDTWGKKEGRKLVYTGESRDGGGLVLVDLSLFLSLLWTQSIPRIIPSYPQSVFNPNPKPCSFQSPGMITRAKAQLPLVLDLAPKLAPREVRQVEATLSQPAGSSPLSSSWLLWLSLGVSSLLRAALAANANVHSNNRCPVLHREEA